MIVTPFQDGMILALSSDEVLAIIPYLKYSTYTFTKLHPPPGMPYTGLTALEYWDVVFSKLYGTDMASNHRRTYLRDMMAHVQISINIPLAPDRTFFAVSSVHMNAIPIAVMSMQDITTATNILRTRIPIPSLPGSSWPLDTKYKDFLHCLMVRDHYTSVHETILYRAMKVYPWGQWFPTLFRNAVDLTAWRAEKDVILGTFAKSRHTSLGFVERQIGVIV